MDTKVKVQVNQSKGVITVEVPLHEETSRSGKMLLIGSTHGFVKTSIEYNGKPIAVSLNVGVKP